MQVGYKQHRNYILTPSRKHLGKHIARGSKLAVAHDCMEDPRAQESHCEEGGSPAAARTSKPMLK